MLLQEGGVYKSRCALIDYIRVTNVPTREIAVGYIIFKDGTTVWTSWDAMGMCEDWPDYEIDELVGLISNPVSGDGKPDGELQ